MQSRSKVQVWIHSQDAHGVRHLLLLRVRPDRGGFWQPVTGGVETFDKSLEAAAFREATEESGIQAWVSQPRSLEYDFKFQDQRGDCHEFVYEVETRDALPKITLDPDEHVEYEWMTPKKAMSLLKFPSNQEGLQRLLQRWNIIP
ncbi:MAG: NUDIX domain-containing protein [Methylotenera sp.]|nr:NUDIX domain-containing protein [Oligoflexia bacterium]